MKACKHKRMNAMNKSPRRECAHAWQLGNRAIKQIAQKKSDDPIISLSARTDAEEKERARGTKGRKRKEMWYRVGMFYVEIIILIRSQSPHEHQNLDRIVGLTHA